MQGKWDSSGLGPGTGMEREGGGCLRLFACCGWVLERRASASRSRRLVYRQDHIVGGARGSFL
jgi:hypothetical protein